MRSETRDLKYKIGIIGGAGFIGASLAKHLIKNFQVKLLDVKPPEDLKEAANCCYCDVRNYKEVVKMRCSGVSNVCLHNAIELSKLGNEVVVYAPKPRRKLDGYQYPKSIRVRTFKHVFSVR